jgi:hypothetical protein
MSNIIKINNREESLLKYTIFKFINNDYSAIVKANKNKLEISLLYNI